MDPGKRELQKEAAAFATRLATELATSPQDHVAVLIDPRDNKYVLPFIAHIFGDNAEMGGQLADGRVRVLVRK